MKLTQLAEPMNVEDALAHAKLDWTATKKPLFGENGNEDEKVPVKNVCGIYREDTSSFLPGVSVSDQYEIVQNSDVFATIDPILGEGEASIHKLGEAYGGCYTFMSVRLPKVIQVEFDNETRPSQKLEKWLLITNSFDTSHSVRINLQVRDKGSFVGNFTSKCIRFKHTTFIHDRLPSARKALGLSNDFFDLAGKKLKEIALIDSSKRRAEYMAILFRPHKDTPRAQTIASNKAEEALKWVAANSAGAGDWYHTWRETCRFLHFQRKHRSQDAYWKSSAMGAIMKKKVQAFNVAISMSGVTKPNWKMYEGLFT
jgi:hypothetical protein